MVRSHSERRKHWAAIMVAKPELDAKLNAASDKKRIEEQRARDDAKQAAILSKIRADKEYRRAVKQRKREERKERDQQANLERQNKVRRDEDESLVEVEAAAVVTTTEQEDRKNTALETITKEEQQSMGSVLQTTEELIVKLRNFKTQLRVSTTVLQTTDDIQESGNVILHTGSEEKYQAEAISALSQSTPDERQEKVALLLHTTSAVNQVLGNITLSANKRTVAAENIMNIINKGGAIPSGKENRIINVESALAELDSLPDGDNDPGHYRDTPEDDWQRYGDMDTSSNQTDELSAVNYQQHEQEPVRRHESPLMADSPDPYKSEPMEVPQRNGGGSPHSEVSPSGSPRSVEGFVTSVELNTAQEQLANSTAAAFDLDTVPLEQQSGPFSVYVSSSPEPASLDPLADASVHKVASPSPSADYEMQNSAINSESVGQTSPSPVALETEQHSNVFEHPPSPLIEDTSSVEIVHAQSMVEVVAPPSPTHEPELQFVTSQPLESEPVPSPVYTPAPLNDMMSNDLMSTSMILEQPISDAPEQVEQMMQFMTTNTEVVYNSLEQQQTAEVVHITSESDRLMSPEVESGNLLDAEDSEASYPVSSPAPVTLSPVAAQPVESPVSPQSEDDSLVEQMNRANISDSYNAPSEQIVSPSEQVELVPSPVQEELVEAELLTATVEVTPEEQTPESCDERHSPVPSPIQLDHSPISDVMPSTPIKEPMIGNRPISPINTPKADIPVHDSEILSEIAPPSADQENAAAKKAPVRPTPRTTTAASTRSRPTASAVASTKTTPATTNVKPGTPRPTARATPAARTTPGGAVRSSTTTTTTTTKATPTTRTPAPRTTPSSRSTSATSTSTTRTTTTRAPVSRTATPSATRTTPSSSATRPTPSTGSASRPTPTTRTSRPTTTPTSTTLKTTTTRTTPRSASRPTSAATTPTTTRRGLTSSTTTTTTVRRTLASASAAAAKDSTDSKTSTTTTTTARAPYTRKPLYPGPAAKTATAGTKTTAAADKDVKNSTNKLLSSRTTTVSKSTAGTTASRATTATAPTHKPFASKTTTTTGLAKRVGSTTSTLKSRTTTTKTGLKAKSPVIMADSSDDKEEIPSPETNGEVKIAQEETSVEVVTKEENEEIVDVNGQEELVTTTTTLTEVLVNGDGEH